MVHFSLVPPAGSWVIAVHSAKCGHLPSLPSLSLFRKNYSHLSPIVSFFYVCLLSLWVNTF